MNGERRGSGTRRWRLAFAAATAAALALYAAQTLFAEVRPGNRWAVGYGIAAALLAVVAAAYGARRRAQRLATRLGAGSAQGWLRLHLLAGGLFLLLVGMHSGFRLPTGWITGGLWLVSLLTVAGGLGGLALQRFVPRQLASGLTLEVHYDRIPELVADLGRRAAETADGADESIRRLWETRVAPEMEAPRRRWRYFVDPSGGIRARTAELGHLERFLDPTGRATLAELTRLYRAKLEIDAHYTLQRALRAWPALHTPLAVLLLALLALHLVAVLYY